MQDRSVAVSYTHLSDGSMIAIDTIVVENEIADNMYQRSELDYLIYNAPLELPLLHIYSFIDIIFSLCYTIIHNSITVKTHGGCSNETDYFKCIWHPNSVEVT